MLRKWHETRLRGRRRIEITQARRYSRTGSLGLASSRKTPKEPGDRFHAEELVDDGARVRIPVAHAQSSVTLYGIVDVGIENLDVGSVDATRLQSGISAGSRWGIRGSEELKPGWRACLRLKAGLRPTPAA